MPNAPQSSHVLTAVDALALQGIHHCHTRYLEASGCVVGYAEIGPYTGLWQIAPRNDECGWAASVGSWTSAVYKVLEIAGDATVKSQVIVRYISADTKATELAASSVALTPANYKIHYEGCVWLGNRLTYAFRMIPRKKREGLIKGVLWLDSETGIAVRESGYLAKSPSLFVKRINLTRENELQNGTIAQRITHVSVETRLIGRAQLIIVQRPTSAEATVRGAGEDGQ